MTAEKRPRILCVDDEPNVLEGLKLHLDRRYEVKTAPNGHKALELLRNDSEIAVIISDQRMPGMTGVGMLHQARTIAPDAMRVLLTGHADLEGAIAAVNEGQLFRFLTKPCPPPQLLSVVEAAVTQRRLIAAERSLLEDTLIGSMKAMMDVLAVANPLAFGRTSRVSECVGFLAQELGLDERWQMRVAAMVSQMGLISLPEPTLEKVYEGEPLTLPERQMLEKANELPDKLLRRIPRMEPVREILAGFRRPFRASDGSIEKESVTERGRAVLKVAIDFDELELQGQPIAIAVDTLRGREGAYDGRVIDALCAVYGDERQNEVREVSANQLKIGMVTVEEVRMTSGTLVVPRGFEVTQSLVDRMKNFGPRTVREPIRVMFKERVEPQPGTAAIASMPTR